MICTSINGLLGCIKETYNKGGKEAAVFHRKTAKVDGYNTFRRLGAGISGSIIPGSIIPARRWMIGHGNELEGF